MSSDILLLVLTFSFMRFLIFQGFSMYNVWPMYRLKPQCLYAPFRWPRYSQMLLVFYTLMHRKLLMSTVGR